MINRFEPCDPAVHALATRLARKCTDIIRPLLRQEEVGECLREMYFAIRCEIEKKPGRESEV
ncbi:hypothetical protein OJF2_51840 [Aquisphaera giovannonii]|uniref:Uncharacterized protein n=1 Tax=Aquisphaera giovannonii TaxID=406548 RepID=A0A5B9W9S9_9BACT|nr:hypothetical protein OJF2_51840 [Aquisphaera giovannonii]